jgi:small conductance mechanosensitive channel
MNAAFSHFFDSKAMMVTLHQLFLAYALNIVFAVIIFLLGWWMSRIICRIVNYLFKKNKLEETVRDFACRILYVALMVMVVIATLSKLGVQTGSIIAVLGAASLAVALSLKNYLSNFASGILLISSRLFHVGDAVEIDGKTGTVKNVHIFFTTLKTADNQLITIPNSSVVGKNIIHYSSLPTRRINIVVGIGYDDDIDLAKKTLMDVMLADSRSLNDPAPAVMVKELADSSVNLLARCWVLRADYFSLMCDLNEAMKKACDAHKINIPYPQHDVHLIR